LWKLFVISIKIETLAGKYLLFRLFVLKLFAIFCVILEIIPGVPDKMILEK